MNKLMIILTFTALFYLTDQTIAQTPQGNSQGQMPMDGKVTGTIMDAGTGQPVEYASVALFRMKDSTLVNGGLSNNTGNFSIENTPYGRFYLEIAFVGYKKQRVKGILVTPNQKTANTGSIKIETTSTAIKEVVVEGNQAPIQYRIDKKVIDVSQNAIAAGGTVVDALQNAPSVQTDVEGNVTVRGSGNFTVLIDGKPSVIQGSEALQQIPASLVQNVEIITNPSAKYDAEGSAGIINVIMKKQKIRGTNGVINLTAGRGDKYSGNINVNYKNNKFNYSVGADFSNMKFSSENYSISTRTITKNEPISYQRFETVNGNGNFHRYGFGFKAAIEYTINANNTITLSGNGGQRTFERPTSSSYKDSFSNNYPVAYYLNNNSGISKRTFFNTILDYQFKLNDKGHQLAATAYFSKGPDQNNSILRQDTTDANWNILNNKFPFIDNTTQTGNKWEFRSKADYSLPIGEKAKLEAGYQGRYTQTKGDQTINDTLVDKINFRDQFQEVYATFSKQTLFVDFMLGLRSSYEHRIFDQLIQKKTSILDKINWFPTVHLSRQLPWDLQIQASYSRRISRPRDWNLDPLPVKISSSQIRIGNPDLGPELSDSYELNFQKKLSDASFLSVEGFYRSTKDLIQNPIISNKKSNYDTITFVNVNHDRSMGVEFMLNLAFAKWVNFNASSSIFDYRMYSDSLEINRTTTWNLRINPTFRLPTGTSIQFNYQYNAPTITLQGTRNGNYTSSLGIRQEILKRKGSLTLQVRGLLGQEKYSNTISTPLGYTYNYNKRETRVVMLTFNYRINNYKAQQNKRNAEDTNPGNGGEVDMNGGGM